MDETSIIVILTTLVSALGLKQIWSIWKKKIDVKSQKDILLLSKEHQILHVVIEEQKVVIEEMKDRIVALEGKIEILINENRDCAVKLARMEERLLASAKTRSSKRKSTKVK